jgi:hypothetical protein
VSDDQSLQRQGKLAIARNRKARRSQKKLGTWDGRTASGIIVPDPEPSPEHYHIIYHVPKEGLSLPRWNTLYVTLKEAREYIFDLGLKAEPRAEFYENGQVGIETPMHGREGLFWIVLEVAACIRPACLQNFDRARMKRSLVLMPGSK